MSVILKNSYKMLYESYLKNLKDSDHIWKKRLSMDYNCPIVKKSVPYSFEEFVTLMETDLNFNFRWRNNAY